MGEYGELIAYWVEKYVAHKIKARLYLLTCTPAQVPSPSRFLCLCTVFLVNYLTFHTPYSYKLQFYLSSAESLIQLTVLSPKKK